MSLIQDLGARLRATSDELPTGLVAVAVERLRTAAELLMWVRQTSVNPVGVPQLANATEHAEQAAYALRVAQDALARYLTTIGLAADAVRPADGDWRTALEVDETRPPPAADDEAPAPLRHWWTVRVAALTGHDEPSGDDEQGAGATGTADLLRRVAAGVRSADRARLRRDLGAVDAPVGLGLSAVTPPLLHRLAGDLLGHEPRADDLQRLTGETAGRVRDLLPGLPAPVVDALLARVCRVPPAQGASGEPAHPADSAVASGVLAGVLLARLGRDPAGLVPDAPEPLREREPDA
jgi:hypothetical protein